MNIICVVVCDDCGKSLINDPNSLSIFIADYDNMAVTVCPQCKQPITVNLDKEKMRVMAHRGVKLFSWYSASPITPESIQ